MADPSAPITPRVRQNKEAAFLRAQHQVKVWMDGVLGEPLASENLTHVLKDGSVLCQLGNKLKPFSIAKIHENATGFKQVENCNMFLRVCRSLGVPEMMLFSPTDLVDGKNMWKVVTCLQRLSSIAPTANTVETSAVPPSPVRSPSATAFAALPPSPSPTKGDNTFELPPADVGTVRATFAKFKAHVDAREFDAAWVVLAQLKRDMTTFSVLPLFELTGENAREELALARDILELGTLLSVRARDVPAFERHFAQLRQLYTDVPVDALPASPQRVKMLGLNLLRLLAQNRIAEFHTELELIAIDEHDDVHIRYALLLEQHVMAGSYSRIAAARTELPGEEFGVFTDMLMETVRDEIAGCSERAYDGLRVADASRVLMCDAGTIESMGKARGWAVDGGVISFPKEESTEEDIPTLQIIREMLSYAKEMERIV